MMKMKHLGIKEYMLCHEDVHSSHFKGIHIKLLWGKKLKDG